MAQHLIRSFVRELSERVELPDPIVEFGSMQVEADQEGDLRPLFAGRDFTGTDMREGPGVDRVEDLRRLSFPDGTVGTALCIDTLEHCADPPQACRELARVVGPGGVCVITSVMHFGIHAYPADYYRFTPEGFRALLEGFDDVWVCGLGDPNFPVNVIGVGANDRSLNLSLDSFPALVAAQRRYEAAEGRVRVGVLNHPPAELFRDVSRQVPRLIRERIRRR